MATKKENKRMRDSNYFRLLQGDLEKNGLWELTADVMEKIWTVNKLQAPDVERTADVKDRVSFIVNVHNYALTVHTTFNRAIGQFSPYGVVTIVIEKLMDKSSKAILFRFFYRKADGGHIRRIDQYVRYILKELKYGWPLTAKGNRAELKEFKNEQFHWVDEGGKKIRIFFGNDPSFRLITRIERQKKYYHKVARKRLGVKGYRRNIRKKYAKKK